eukprot:UN01775
MCVGVIMNKYMFLLNQNIDSRRIFFLCVFSETNDDLLGRGIIITYYHVYICVCVFDIYIYVCMHICTSILVCVGYMGMDWDC